MLRPIRDILFFPFMSPVQHTFEIYCSLSKIGLGSYDRCITPIGNGLALPDGPPSWFNWAIVVFGIIAIILFYGVVFTLIIELRKRFFKKFANLLMKKTLILILLLLVISAIFYSFKDKMFPKSFFDYFTISINEYTYDVAKVAPENLNAISFNFKNKNNEKYSTINNLKKKS